MKKLIDLLEAKSSLIALILIAVIFLIIPLKIMSYGWIPEDDALRHSAFATLSSEKNWNDICVIEKGFEADHNPGWHSILRFLHNKLHFSKQNLLRFSVVGLFLLFTFCGIAAAPSPVCWLLAFLTLLTFEASFLGRMLLGRPYIISCAITLLIMKYWISKDESSYTKIDAKGIILSTVLFALGTWTHGSWYLYFLIPVSFLLAGKCKNSLNIILAIVIGTIIGALMTGDFNEFLKYHIFATTSIFTEKTFNWLLVSELASGNQPTSFMLYGVAIIALCVYKKKLTLKDLTTDPAFLLLMLSWLLSIMVVRFWIDWGRIALLFWLSQRAKDILDSTESLKEPRVKYCLFIFILCTLFFMSTNDGSGRFSRVVFNQPIDFTEKRLEGWAPEPGGIVYSDAMCVFYKHFFEYPTAPWRYILGFEPAIMPKEDLKIHRQIGYNFRRAEEFLPWINKMTTADRIISIGPIGDFPQLESIRGARNYWIYRLKTASESADISIETTTIDSDSMTQKNIATETSAIPNNVSEKTNTSSSLQ